MPLRCAKSLIEGITHNDNSKEYTGLALSTALLSVLLALQTIGVFCFIYKVKSSARKAIKKDINPLYGVDYEGESENKNPRSDSVEQSYDYMGS